MPELKPGLINPDGTPLRAPRDRRRAGPWNGVGGPGSLQQSFRGASWLSQELAGWMPSLTSPTAEIWPARDSLVARSQDITRNNGYAAGAKQTLVDSIIGARWRLMPMPNWSALGITFQQALDWAAAVEPKWRAYAEDPGCWIDASRWQRFSGLLRTQFTTWFGTGEHFSVAKWLPERVMPGKAHYATCLQLIDPDRVSNPFGAPELPDQRMGVQLGEHGEAVGYHIREAHPMDFPNAYKAMRWDYVPRETWWGRPVVLHGLEIEREGNVRGKPPLAAIVESFRLQDVYERYEALGAILNAVYSAVIETDFGSTPEAVEDMLGLAARPGHLLDPSDDTRRVMRHNGVEIPVMDPGFHLQFKSPARPAGAQFDAFEAAVLRRIAAGIGLSYEQISRDYSRTNYSSARASLLEAWKFMQGRSEFFQTSFADPVYALWLEEAINKGEIETPKGAPNFYEAKSEWTECSWIGPGRGWIDPVKEVTASVMKMDAGISTLRKEAAEQGEDWREIAEERAYEAAFLKRLGLTQPGTKQFLDTARTIETADEPEESAPAGDKTKKAA